MRLRVSFVALLVAGFGLDAAGVGLASGSGRADGSLSIQGGIDEPHGGTTSPFTPKQTARPALSGWMLDRVEMPRPLADSDDDFRPSPLGPGWRLGRAPPLA